MMLNLIFKDHRGSDMAKLLRKCVQCHEYSILVDKCPYCGGELKNPHPPKFSIEKEEKYSKYRRKMLMEAGYDLSRDYRHVK